MDEKNKAAVELGRLGGLATKKRGVDYYRMISAKAHKARWGRRKKVKS